jgi:hypothetical protein
MPLLRFPDLLAAGVEGEKVLRFVPHTGGIDALTDDRRAGGN